MPIVCTYRKKILSWNMKSREWMHFHISDGKATEIIMSSYNLQRFEKLSICEKQTNSSQQHRASFKLTYDLLTWKYKFESIIFDLNTLGCVNDVGLQSSGPLFKDFYKPEEVGLFISLPCAKGSRQWDNLNSVIEKIYLIFVYGISQWAFDKRNAIF